MPRPWSHYRNEFSFHQPLTLFLCHSDSSLTLERSTPGMSHEPRDILGAVCETGGWTLWRNTPWRLRFCHGPWGWPFRAKQETIMVPPPHPLNSLLRVPYIRHQGVTVKSALSNIYFGTEKPALADIHQTAKVLSVRWHHVMMSRTSTHTTLCRNT